MSELTPPEVATGPKLVLAEYAKLIDVSRVLTLQLTGNQTKRVLRSLLRAPFEAPDTFQDKKEKELFSVGMRIMDIKMMLVADQLKNMEKELSAVNTEASKLETQEETKGETNNG